MSVSGAQNGSGGKVTKPVLSNSSLQVLSGSFITSPLYITVPVTHLYARNFKPVLVLRFECENDPQRLMGLDLWSLLKKGTVREGRGTSGTWGLAAESRLGQTVRGFTHLQL